jgi:hypothetical protein
MALKLLNPGLRPLGMFDLDDLDAGALQGGEYVELKQEAAVGAEGYAADVEALADADGIVNFVRSSRAAGAISNPLGGLADEGDAGDYGTLFGQLIGSNAGRATTVSGAVVLGPETDRASGKVTVWAQAGLYGVTDGADTLGTADPDTNASLGAMVTTGLLDAIATTGNSQVAIYIGAMADTSLVSTSSVAAGGAAQTEYHAVFYLGNAQA